MKAPNFTAVFRMQLVCTQKQEYQTGWFSKSIRGQNKGQ